MADFDLFDAAGVEQVAITAPIVREHCGVHVVRDDLYPGGTKARFLPLAFASSNHVVYGSPCEGGAQLALAHVAHALGKSVSLVLAKRQKRHPATQAAAELGATIVEISAPSYLTVVQARAREYAYQQRARLLPFGLDMPGAIDVIADTARAAHLSPDEVWCVSSSGVLARGLAKAWPDARLHLVQVGHAIDRSQCPHATVHIYPGSKLSDKKSTDEFSCNPHYEGKAWQLCQQHHGDGIVVFWNVTTDPWR